MAEIFGVVSGAVCILDATISLTGTFLKYVSDFRDEQKERIRLVEVVFVLRGVLPRIRTKIQEAEASNDVDYRTAVQRLVGENGPLEHCKLALERINKKLDSKSQESKSQKNIPELSLIKKLKWPFKLADIEEDLDRIEKFKSLAMVIMTSGFTEEIRKELETQLAPINAKADIIQRDVKGLLSKMNSQERHLLAEWVSDVTSVSPPVATEGTGDWFIESRQFSRWDNGECRVLYCPGHAGAGKTTLMTTVIKYLDKFLADPEYITIRFHFHYQSSKDMILPQLMEFILKQLLYHRALSSTTEKLLRYRAKPPSRPNESEILTLLQEEIRTYTRVFLVLDALDESPGEMGMSIRHFILSNLPDNVSLLCTSRDIPEITRSFDGEMRIDINAHDSDLRVYLHSYLQSAPKLRTLMARVVPALNEKAMSSKVLKKAHGIFLLARLIMDHLRAQKTPNNLVAALEYLPSSLDNMYKQTLDRSPNQEQALCLLSWVLLAERSLSVDELRHAVAWRVDATELLDDGDLEDEESLLSLCAGLVMLRREKREKGSKGDSWQGSDEYNTVVFTHYTTQDYVAKLATGLLSHENLALLSIHYLRHHVPITAELTLPPSSHCRARFGDVPLRMYTPSSRATLLPRQPFFGYCLQFWPKHALQCTESEVVKESALALLTEERQMDLLYKMSGLHFACREGLHHLIHDLSTHMPQSLNVTSGHASPMTPLQFASHNGHELVVRELLSNVSLNVNAKDGKGRTALMYAVKSGHQEIVQLLRNSEGIDADTADSCGWRVIDFIEMSDSEG